MTATLFGPAVTRSEPTRSQMTCKSKCMLMGSQQSLLCASHLLGMLSNNQPRELAL